MDRLLKFLKQHNGLLFYVPEHDCFSIVVDNQLTHHQLISPNQLHISFVASDINDSMVQFVEPCLQAIERELNDSKINSQ